MRLIDADALLKALRERHDELEQLYKMAGEVEEIIDELSTIRAIPIVNCIDCVYYNAESHYCNSANVDRIVWFWETDNHFCFSYKQKDGSKLKGVRKDDSN